MKNYTITVNGNTYDVTVEENGASSSSAPVAPKSEPKAVKPIVAGNQGSVKIEAGAAGKVFKIERGAGTQVKKGDTVIILEVMKMETPVVAPEDGTVASIEVAEGQSVEAGALLATLN